MSDSAVTAFPCTPSWWSSRAYLYRRELDFRLSLSFRTTLSDTVLSTGADVLARPAFSLRLQQGEPHVTIAQDELAVHLRGEMLNDGKWWDNPCKLTLSQSHFALCIRKL